MALDSIELYSSMSEFYYMTVKYSRVVKSVQLNVILDKQISFYEFRIKQR